MSAEERPYSQKINIDCTSFSTQPAISKMLLYAVHCDASLTYLSIGYFTWYVLALSSANWRCSCAPLLLVSSRV